ncbi:outer membrane beta-barrel domain-containing protein [Pseudenhygromyxa sp. WMMC2535]|uniref:outer membrane beta-barrel domain-containing protein n=1 Tax=Pseudenhygromyxa sp. WMMC2535 TaxID=2712867 RepID=UPI0015961761|nr:outer membrane beta-barrel domain-containing protein [Pseudenhygromyxa sp. WMMC2535]NVB42200.1 outer membrane beta-barrel domain-containing protein [Pseudenhygromyxa sp. WMMC2535]
MTVMQKNTIKLSLAAAGVCAGLFMAPGEAQAKKPGVLEGKPVVVDRLELRKLRFQITPQIGMSLSQPFVHKGFAGLKLRFDFTDWIGVRASFMYGVLDVDSSLLKAINNGGLPLGTADSSAEQPASVAGPGPYRTIDQLDNPAPLLHDFQAGLTKLQFTASLDLAFTPFSGKLGLFSAIFTEYDIYIFGGVGFTNWARHYENVQSTSEMLAIPNSTDASAEDYCLDPNNGGATNSECLLHPVDADDGFRIGGSFGAGVHLFITDWLSLNPEIHDIVVGHNDAGLNATIDDVPPVVSNTASGDRVARHNVTFNLGLTFYVPPKAKRSRLEQKLRKKK